MKVLILGNSAGGTYHFRVELLQELLKRKHEVFLSVPYDDYVKRIEELGCKVIPTEFDRRGMNPKQEQSLYREYCRIIKDVQPDKMLTYTIKPNIYGGIAAKKYGIPQIANITGLGTVIQNGGAKSRMMLRLYKRGLAYAQVVFFQNQTNYEQLCVQKRIVKGRTIVLHGSGVNLTQHKLEPYPDNDNKLVLLVIGRIMKDKGIDEILYASEIIKREYPQVFIKIIGSYDEGFQSRVKEAVNNGYLEYLGPQDDVHSFIKNSHATISASYHEGMSNVLQETAAAGRPVIATDVPGSIETFEPGVSGIPFKSRDPEDLVRAIKEFITLPYETKVRMGLAGRKRMEELFDRQNVVNKYLEEIEREEFLNVH